jgi:hypothetical protein
MAAKRDIVRPLRIKRRGTQCPAGDWDNHREGALRPKICKLTCHPVIPPFLAGCGCRTYAAIFSFMAGVMPPMPIFGRSVARQGDLIGGSKNSYIATLVEQHSRYVMAT